MHNQRDLDLIDRLLSNSTKPIYIQPGWNIQLRAENPQNNLYRWYSIRIDKNLFGEWCLSLSYGRIGHRGQTKLSFWTDISLLLRQLKRILKKRLNSSKRIGCNYKIVGF